MWKTARHEFEYEIRRKLQQVLNSVVMSSLQTNTIFFSATRCFFPSRTVKKNLNPSYNMDPDF